MKILNAFAHALSLLLYVSSVSAEALKQSDAHPADHMEHMGHQMMPSMYGPYLHTREGSGTAWLPDSTPMAGYHFGLGDWSLMLHGFANANYDNQGKDRGDEKFFSSNMLMLMGAREFEKNTFGFRTMFSLEPTMGKEGYPLLLQTGETADGEHELIDRQHPHDLFMELALTYSRTLTDNSSVFLYGGLPGEPALGPAAFMHRISGMDIPDAPITHHWLDSTHITFGVVTAGVVLGDAKLEGSVFNGHEPDEDRYNIETDTLDSYSGRFSYNIGENWSVQTSFGYLDSPEQLHPGINTRRVTASATHNLPLDDGNLATTFAWGRNNNDGSESLDAFLLESALTLNTHHTLFSRIENVEKNELFPEDTPQHGEVFRVSKLSLGYIYDIFDYSHVRFGIGGEGSVSLIPSSIEPTYGSDPLSFFIFLRAKVI